MLKEKSIIHNLKPTDINFLNQLEKDKVDYVTDQNLYMIK